MTEKPNSNSKAVHKAGSTFIMSTYTHLCDSSCRMSPQSPWRRDSRWEWCSCSWLAVDPLRERRPPVGRTLGRDSWNAMASCRHVIWRNHAAARPATSRTPDDVMLWGGRGRRKGHGLHFSDAAGGMWEEWDGCPWARHLASNCPNISSHYHTFKTVVLALKHDHENCVWTERTSVWHHHARWKGIDLRVKRLHKICEIIGI